MMYLVEITPPYKLHMQAKPITIEYVIYRELSQKIYPIDMPPVMYMGIVQLYRKEFGY